MEKRVKYADLLGNALILQNAVDMTRGLHQLHNASQPFDPELLAFLSPYWTRHVRRLGNYSPSLDLPCDEVLFEIPIPSVPNQNSEAPQTPI